MAGRTFTVSRNKGRQELYEQMARSLWPWAEETARVELNHNEDFCKQLQSGVILCKLLNEVRPGTVTKPIKDDGLVFSAAENIKNFLDALKNQLGFRSVDLFQSTDLIQLSNKISVLQTLDVLRDRAPQFNPSLGSSKPAQQSQQQQQQQAPDVARGRNRKGRSAVDLMSMFVSDDVVPSNGPDPHAAFAAALLVAEAEAKSTPPLNRKQTSQRPLTMVMFDAPVPAAAATVTAAPTVAPAAAAAPAPAPAAAQVPPVPESTQAEASSEETPAPLKRNASLKQLLAKDAEYSHSSVLDDSIAELRRQRDDAADRRKSSYTVDGSPSTLRREFSSSDKLSAIFKGEVDGSPSTLRREFSSSDKLSAIFKGEVDGSLRREHSSSVKLSALAALDDSEPKPSTHLPNSESAAELAKPKDPRPVALPVQEPIEPMPVQKPVESVPVEEPIEPAPVEEPVPVQEPIEPVPVEEPVPVQEPIEPVPVEVPVPVQEPVEPVQSVAVEEEQQPIVLDETSATVVEEEELKPVALVETEMKLEAAEEVQPVAVGVAEEVASVVEEPKQTTEPEPSEPVSSEPASSEPVVEPELVEQLQADLVEEPIESPTHVPEPVPEPIQASTPESPSTQEEQPVFIESTPEPEPKSIAMPDTVTVATAEPTPIATAEPTPVATAEPTPIATTDFDVVKKHTYSKGRGGDLMVSIEETATVAEDDEGASAPQRRPAIAKSPSRRMTRAMSRKTIVMTAAELEKMEADVQTMKQQLRTALFDVYRGEVVDLCDQLESRQLSPSPFSGNPTLNTDREARVKAMCAAWNVRPVAYHAPSTVKKPPPVSTRSSSTNVIAGHKVSLLDLIEMQNEPDFDDSEINEEFTAPKGIKKGMRVLARWDYSPMNPDELMVVEDDVITIVKVESDGWWEGEIDGRVGWFPSNYVVAHEAFTPLSPDGGQSVINSHTPPSIRMQLAPSGTVLDLHDQNRGWYKKYREASQDIKGGKSGKRKYPSAKEYEKIMRQTWSEIVPAELVQTMPEKEVQRQERLYELLKTEREYVNDLDVIIEVFLKPIASRKLVTVKDLGILFSNVEQLLTIHQELLRLLELQHENSKVIVDVGPAFDKTMEYFKMYTLYCSNHSFAVLKYQNMNNKPLKKFIEEAMRLPECRSLSLSDFLIKPVQRICKYPLLLKEILDKTSEESQTVPMLKDILQRIETVVALVNESIRQSEGLRHSADLQNRFVEKTNFATPTRKLLREDVVYVVEESDKKAQKGKPTKRENMRNIFLFNDLFLLAKPISGDKLSLLHMQSYEGLKISGPRADDPEGDYFYIENTFTKTPLIVYVSQPDVKGVWVRLGKRVTDNLAKQRALPRQPSSGKLLPPPVAIPLPAAFSSVETQPLSPGSVRSSLSLSDYVHGIAPSVEDILYANQDEEEVSTYYYAVEIQIKDRCTTTFKSFEEFFALHMALISAFPVEAGLRNEKRTLPELPSQRVLVSYAVAKDRIEQLDSYLSVLMLMPASIALSPLVVNFFEPNNERAQLLTPIHQRPVATSRASVYL